MIIMLSISPCTSLLGSLILGVICSSLSGLVYRSAILMFGRFGRFCLRTLIILVLVGGPTLCLAGPVINYRPSFYSANSFDPQFSTCVFVDGVSLVWLYFFLMRFLSRIPPHV